VKTDFRKPRSSRLPPPIYTDSYHLPPNGNRNGAMVTICYSTSVDFVFIGKTYGRKKLRAFGIL